MKNAWRLAASSKTLSRTSFFPRLSMRLRLMFFLFQSLKRDDDTFHAVYHVAYAWRK
jgi:hypothetical protein